MHSLVDQKADRQSALRSHEMELNRIDTALLASAKSGSRPPSSLRTFRALGDASIACADILDEYADRPIPLSVRNDLSRLHCAMTDLGVSLASYATLHLKDR